VKPDRSRRRGLPSRQAGWRSLHLARTGSRPAVPGSGTVPSDGCQAGRATRSPRGGDASNPRCKGGRERRRAPQPPPPRTISPAYMTSARVGDLRYDTEVVGDQEDRRAHSSRGPQERQDLGLDGHVEAVVGSSATRSLGRRPAPCDRRPLLHGRRHPVRVVVLAVRAPARRPHRRATRPARPASASRDPGDGAGRR